MPVLSLHTIVQEVEDQALLPNSLVQRERKLEILQLLLSGCEQPLKQIVNFVATHGSLAQANKKLKDKLTFGLEDLHDARSKITLHTSAISVFLTTLSNASLERIERKLEKLFKAVSAGTRESSVLSLANEPATGTDTEQQWDMFRTEMMTEGIPRDELDDNKSFVQVKINDLMRSTPSLPAVSCLPEGYSQRRIRSWGRLLKLKSAGTNPSSTSVYCPESQSSCRRCARSLRRAKSKAPIQRLYAESGC